MLHGDCVFGRHSRLQGSEDGHVGERPPSLSMMFHHLLHHSIYRCDRPCLFVFELWNPPAGYPYACAGKAVGRAL